MRTCLSLVASKIFAFTVALVLLAAGIASAQTRVKVAETESQIEYADRLVRIVLPVTSEAAVPNTIAKIELLDTEGVVRLADETRTDLPRGLTKIEIAATFSEERTIDEVAAYRLRYSIVDSAGSEMAAGIIAVVEILADLFELVVTAPERIVPGNGFRAHLAAFNPATMKPIDGVAIVAKLTIESEAGADAIEEFSGRTDSNGILTIEFPVPADATKGGSLGVIARRGEFIRQTDQYFSPLYSRFRPVVTTDKPIYQPGQTLAARVLLLDYLDQPAKSKEIEYEIVSQNRQKIASGTVTTSDYGIASLTWLIPDGAPRGRYSLQVSNSETEFVVSNYELPNFKVDAKAERKFYLPSEGLVRVEVNATYLFGKPVPNGSVRIETLGTEDKDPAILDGRTGSGGRFFGEIDIAPFHDAELSRDWNARFADIEMIAYVTDPSTNRTESRRFDIRLSKEPIHVYLSRRSSSLGSDVPSVFYIAAFYADGTPAKCEITVDGKLANSEENVVVGRTDTNSYGVGRIEYQLPERFVQGSPEIFKLRITAVDGNGSRGTHEEELSAWEDSRQIRVEPDKTIYASGEAISASIFANADFPRVLVDVVGRKGTLESKMVELADGRGSVRFPYRKEFSGILTLTAYSPMIAGESVNSSVIFPDPRQIGIKVKGLKQRYRPNDELAAKVEVDAKDGRGTSAALGVIVFDGAIEERSRIERWPDNLRSIREALGEESYLGGITLNGLHNLDRKVSSDDELQMAAGFLLAPRRFDRYVERSESAGLQVGRAYLPGIQRQIEPLVTAIRSRYADSGEFPRSHKDLLAAVESNGLDQSMLLDPWGVEYQSKFVVDNLVSILTLTSVGPDKAVDTDDDIRIVSLRFEWFRRTKQLLERFLTENRTSNGAPVRNSEDALAVWKARGIEFEKQVDGWGRPMFLVDRTFLSVVSVAVPEVVVTGNGQRSTVLRARLMQRSALSISVISSGANGIRGDRDDVSVGEILAVIDEKLIDDDEANRSAKPVTGLGKTGSVKGSVADVLGGRIPNARLTLEDKLTGNVRETSTDRVGEFQFLQIPTGSYRLRCVSPGFMTLVSESVIVEGDRSLSLELVLEAAAVTNTVDIVAPETVFISSTDSSIGSSTDSAKTERATARVSTDEPAATPRLREYFPETLFWQPEATTDENGRAEFRFRLADNLTNWKMYIIGSTADGRLALAEREFETFQPFFAELEPPKVLTEGDEVSLPVPLRNYTGKARRVSVTSEPNNWSTNLSPAKTEIDVLANSSRNAVFRIAAVNPSSSATQKITARSDGLADSIEKTLEVRPFGKEIVQTQSALFYGSSSIELNFPEDSSERSRRAVLKFYPNFVSHLFESVDGILQRPHGCGEQTASSTYPNLLLLRLERDLGLKLGPETRKRASYNLQQGYKRLLNFQDETGFGIWSGDDPNIELTAYALRLLSDAKPFVDVDQDRVLRAETWLLGRQNPNGTWQGPRPLITTAYVLRSLMMIADVSDRREKALRAGLDALKSERRLSNPYVLAVRSMLARRFGDVESAERDIEAILISANVEFGRRMVSWSSDFAAYSTWGTAATIESTALALSALIESSETRKSEHVRGALSYLMEAKDRYGVWHTTQATVTALDSLFAFQKAMPATNSGTVQLFANGRKVRDIVPDRANPLRPIEIDLKDHLSGSNRLELRTAEKSIPLMAQIVATHYVDWSKQTENDRFWSLNIKYDRTTLRVGEPITLTAVMRPKFTFAGMSIAEVGLPPGADVDRSDLEKLIAKGVIQRYEINADKVIVYFSSANEVRIDFRFRPRLAMNALSAPSRVFEYYNPTSERTTAPVRFVVTPNSQ